MGLIEMGVGHASQSVPARCVFEPEIIQVMTGTYEKLLDDLELVDRDDPLAEVIAKGVIEAARLGVHDVAEMRLWVLNALGKPH